MLLPKIQAYDGGLEVVDVFRGLNRAEKISEGEWSEELNLTTDRFPMLSVRKERVSAAQYQGNIVDMLAKDDLYVLVHTSSEGDYVTTLSKGVTNPTLLHTFVTETFPKGMISFGAYIIILGINAWYNTADGTSGTIAEMPDMDFVIECQNRLWGCFYGEKEVEENGETVTKIVNEIYASELGKFDSWSNYDGTSVASYAASVGTDGAWTGAVSYQGRPHFFKEKHVHKVYVSATGAHQIVDNPLLGVQEGCAKSLCVLNGALYYMSREGVCVYDGSTPKVISDELGDILVHSAYFGGAERKLWTFLFEHYEGSYRPELYVYDTERGIWHQESIVDAYGSTMHFAQLKSSLYASFEPSGELLDLLGVNGVSGEGGVAYSCTSGLIGWQNIEQKYISRFDLRLTLPQNATMKVEIEYDSSGTWEEQGTVTGGGTGSVVIPVRPRRCDHFRLRLSGTGEMRMYSWAKRLTKGSDVVL